MRKLLGSIFGGTKQSDAQRAGSQVASTQQFRDAVAAYGRSDYATALRLIRPLANQGDAISQKNLALMYRLGQGVAQDENIIPK